MSNLYKRQEELDLKKPGKVAVVGTGGIGYWVAKYLAMSGCEHIELFDPDVFEEHNLNRIDLPYKFIGMNKADATQKVIQMLREDCTVYAYPFKFNELNVGFEWVIDCTDRAESQLQNQELARKMGSKYFKAGYDGFGFGIHNTIAEWGEGAGGYTIVPSWVVPATIVAALAVAKVMKFHDAECISSVEHLFRFDR